MDIFKSALSYIIPCNFSFLKQKSKKPENNKATLTSPRSINNSTIQYSSKHKESQTSTTKINFFNGQNSKIINLNDKINSINCLDLDLKEDYIRENNNETKSLAFDATRCNSVFTSTKLKSNLTSTLSKIDLSESNHKNSSSQNNFGDKNNDYCSAFYLANKNDIVLKKNNSNSNSNSNSNKVKNNTSSSFSTSSSYYVKKQKISISNNFFIKNNSNKTINNINKNRTYDSYMNTIKENSCYNYDNNSQQIKNELEKNFEYLNNYKTLIIQCNSSNNNDNNGSTVFLSNNFLLKTRAQIISLLLKFKNKLKFSFKTLNLAISYFDYLAFYYTKQNFSNTNINNSNHSSSSSNSNSKNRILNDTQIQYLNSLFLDKYLLTLTLISLSTKANEVKLFRLEELSKHVNYKVHINEIKRGEEAISKILDYNFLEKTLEDLFYMKLEECLLNNTPNSNNPVNSNSLSNKIKITQEEFKSISFDYFNIINKIVSGIYYKLFDIMQLLYDFGLLNNTDSNNTTSFSEMIFSIIMIQLIMDADCIFRDRNITEKLVSILSDKIKDSYSFDFFFNSLLDIINN